MIKLSVFLTRRSDLTHEQFVDYWTQKHASFLASLPGEGPKATRYVRLLPTGDSMPGAETDDADGVAEIWFEKAQDAIDWFTSETYTTIVAADEANFQDRSKMRFLIASEEVVFG